MIEYSIFYRRFGIRKINQLTNPPLMSVNKFFLPFNSVVHYMPDDDNSPGMMQDDIFVQNNKNFVLVQHVDELKSKIGDPISTNIPLTRFITPYHMRFKHSKRIKTLESTLKQDRQILCLNYAYLPKLFRYLSTSRWDFKLNEWKNRQITLWQNVAEVAEKTNRNQFIEMRIPGELPSVPTLQLAEKQLTQGRYHDHFEDPDRLFLLEVWKWLGDDRVNSILNVVKPEHFKKVNFVWFVHGRWTVLNLGLLNDWRKVKGEELKPEAVDTLTLQKRFLRLIMAIEEVKSVNIDVEDDVVDEAPVEEDEKPVEQIQAPQVLHGHVVEHIDKAKLNTNTVTDFEASAKNKLKVPDVKVKVKQKLPDINTEEAEEAPVKEKSDKEIDEDLKALEAIENTKVKHVLDYKPYVPSVNSYENGVMEETARMAKTGMMSGAEFRRMNRLASKFHEIPNPYTGKGKLSDLTIIPKQDTAIAETTPLAQHVPGVLDESMLSSSLEQFDRKYIEKVLPKDIVSMVMQIQKAGIAVQDYKVEKHEDINDHYELHSIKIVPTVGTAATLKIRLPVVSADGVFKANGVQYIMRKQRGD